ncbi:DUF2953 domain-containing protein [Evansella cellulosilytica]|uniref:DUF2953 domain-containing protein n=1 Tax=Evansella cellulosilytica (strain ATCC 21833 / DSM 2522 / FERM P-1141 / JCM 9156 / N-4) TaxID=649639 RepID=E6U146_EVAC2|nr:DUF2953 domain-containing protein [Evansella cellulosilytica]ADU31492.1 hypothetical protein Bcell_3250 [Evansella cellulosilytica DSM 2522]
MNIFLWIIGILFFLLLLIPFLKMRVTMNYIHNGKDDELTLQLKTFFGLIKYEMNFPLLAIDDESASLVFEEKSKSALGEKKKKKKFTVNEFIDDIIHFERLLKHVVGFHTIVRKFLKKMSLEKLNWETHIGTGDAALTGSSSGILWGIKGNVIGIVSNYMKLKVRPNILIQPQFQQMVLKTSFSCIVSFRIGHAILAGLKVLRHWKKGRTLFKKSTEQTSGRDINV